MRTLLSHLSKLGIVSMLMLACWSFTAGAQTIQDADQAGDPTPLQPPDTSSPRDTLRSFLTNVDAAGRAFVQGTQSDVSDRAGLNATMTLDYRATPDNDSWSVQFGRALLLKEILDRIELPPDNEIPGLDQVADGSVTRWAIPDTRITIARVEQGPQMGEFLFSADTVERLERSYLNAKDLPYKSSATTPGIYEPWSREWGVVEQQLRNRLRRVNTSSPRSTLKTFFDTVNRAYTLVMDADRALKADPPGITRKEALRIEKTANNLLRSATATLDLSQVPKAHRMAASIEAVLKLKEILDRTAPPRLESIPDFAVVTAARQPESRPVLRPGEPFRWKYPGSEIEIVEILEGDRQGEFLFSSGTVKRIDDTYQRVRDRPYMKPTGTESRAVWADQSEGFYKFVYTNPGDLIPRLSFLGGFVDSLPDGFKKEHFGNTLWQWIALVLCVLAIALIIFVLLRVLKRLTEKLYAPLDGWLMILAPILILFLVLVANNFIDEDLNITGQVRTGVRTGSHAIVIIMMIWAVVRLCKAIAETVIASPKIQERSLDATLFRITMRIAALLIGGWIVIASVRDLGADLFPLLAGLGVGGLAIALAAQRTFANFIGTLLLSVNKPVKVGDLCRYGDQLGTVEHIGLLATRIRSLERSVVTVPNAEFSEMKLDNLAMRDQRLLKTVLQLRYETTAEQMRYILAALRELLVKHPKVNPDPARVRFVGYGAYSKDVEVHAYLDCQDQNTFLAMQEDVLLRIEDIIDEAGSGFAFPSQTTYLSRDQGVDSEQGKEAEAKVRKWRSSGQLPFPDFEENEKEQLRATLDYPPKGSPGFVGPKTPVDQASECSSNTLSPGDIANLPSLVAKLQEPNQVADYLWGRLSTKTQKLVSDYNAETDEAVREALVRNLNEIIQGPAIYTVDRFSGILRRPETKELLGASLEGEDLARLNRFLLEDAFPEELQSPNPA